MWQAYSINHKPASTAWFNELNTASIHQWTSRPIQFAKVSNKYYYRCTVRPYRTDGSPRSNNNLFGNKKTKERNNIRKRNISAIVLFCLQEY